MTEKLIILARSWQEADRWRRENGVHYANYIYVSSDRVLQGLRLKPFQIIRLGHWWEGHASAAAEIEAELRNALERGRA